MSQKILHYQNFELVLERADGGFRVRYLSSDEEITAVYSLPFSSLELENFILKMGQSRRDLRRVASPELQVAKTFGIRLFESLFAGPIRDRYQKALHDTERQGQGLRFLLRFSDVPELVNVPWEYIYEPSLARFIALSADTPIVRSLDVSRHTSPLKVQAPLRILVMISSPQEYPQLDVEAEWKILNDSLADLIQRGQVTLTRLTHPTLLSLQEQLRKDEYHIFHFIGHGLFSEYKEDGLLLLEDGQGAGAPVSGHYLGILLHDENSLRLAVLNACEGARTSTTDPYAGAAQQLVRQGLPAVIAMQFEVSERTAATLSREFYRSLADNYPVDAALGEARKAIYTQGQDIEWGIPVLYMRSPDGHLFDVEPVPSQSTVPHQPSVPTNESGKNTSDGINVSIKGNVSGQFAIGNNITQISDTDEKADE